MPAPYQVVDTLVDNALLDRLYRRMWRGSLYFTRKPIAQLSRCRSNWEYRVGGATTRMWRNRLIAMTQTHGLIPEVAILADGSGVGSIRIKSASPDPLRSLSIALGLDVSERFEPPRPGALLSEKVPDTFSQATAVSRLDWPTLTFSASPSTPPTETWELERRTFEAHQPAYLLRLGSRHSFVSRTRRWSGFLGCLAREEPFLRVDTQGTVTSRWPFPVPIARQVLWRGAGVTGTSWQTSDRLWFYPFSSVQDARLVLAPWLHAPPGASNEPAHLKIWLKALGQVPGAPAEAVLANWYRAD